MAFEQKEWLDRVSEFPMRRQLTDEDGNVELVTLERADGEVSTEGDAFSASNMNDLEQRVADAFGSIDLTATAISYNDSSTSLGASNVQGAIEKLKKFVSDGKSKIASAITGQGVSTSADATFATMSSNITTAGNNRYNNGYNSGYSAGRARFIQTINCGTHGWGTQKSAPSAVTINIKSKLSNYGSLSTSNFIVANIQSNYGSNPNRHATWSAGSVVTITPASISYNASTGVLTVRAPYVTFNTQDANTAVSYYESNIGLSCDVYCII